MQVSNNYEVSYEAIADAYWRQVRHAWWRRLQTSKEADVIAFLDANPQALSQVPKSVLSDLWIWFFDSQDLADEFYKRFIAEN